MRAARNGWLLAGVCGALLGCAHAQSAPPWYLDKAWTFAGARCKSACPEEVTRFASGFVGRTLVVTVDRFENPLYESCTRDTDYRDVVRRSASDAWRHLVPAGPEAAYPTPVDLALGERPVDAGFVRCGKGQDSNVIAAVVFAEPATAWIVFEQGALLRFTASKR